MIDHSLAKKVAIVPTMAIFSSFSHATIIDDHFDDESSAPWSSLGNSLGANHTITEIGTTLRSEVVANQSNWNTHRGIVSQTTFDPTSLADGFRLIFEVDAQGPLMPGANGFFLGLTSSSTTFFRSNGVSSFGLTFFGNTARTRSNNGVSLVTDDIGNGGSATEGIILNANPNTIQLSSLQDGFTATIEATPSGWSFSINDINNPSGSPVLIEQSGTWAAAGTSYAQIFGSTSNWHVLASNQGDPTNNSHFVAIDRIVLEAIDLTDSDNDGMPDPYEIANGTNPQVDDSALDSDQDGIPNLNEFLGQNQNGELTGYGQTRSGRPDSDGDGINDNLEIAGTLNPWTDGRRETPPGDPTNPNSPDSDGDGINDDQELQSGTDPNAPPPNSGPTFPFVDRDGDSYRDEAETAFGSDPDDPNSIPDHRTGPGKPNLLIIYADDLGFGDMSAYGDLFGTTSPARTPNLDQLAAEGTLFTQAHSSNAVCTPSRYALLTGKYNWREFDGITLHYGGTKGGREVPRPEDLTIAEFLKNQGYDTAAFGKWHLGGAFYTRTGTRITGNPNDASSIDWARPVEHHAVANGFDSFQGLATTINIGPYVYLENDRVQFWDSTLNGGSGGYRDATNSDPFRWFTTTELNSTVFGGKDSRASLGDPSYTQVGAEPKLISDVETWFANRADSEDSDPFFAYVSLYSPHLPWAVTPPFQNSVGFDYGDFMKEVDNRIGRILSALDDNGYRNNTIVMFSSDNGPENLAMSRTLANGADANGPLRGNKRDIWEGGTRVPMVVRWPGQAAAGQVVTDLVWQGDLYATMAAALKVDIPANVAPDGESFLNLIRGQQKPDGSRPSLLMSSIRGDLALKTTTGWKFIDSSGGGHSSSWDSSNQSIPNAAGTNRGNPKQLFDLRVDLGEDTNLIADSNSSTTARSRTLEITGIDLLGELDQYRLEETTARYPRITDNDRDGIPNASEIALNLDPDWPLDARQDSDGDGQSNRAEWIAGTDPFDSEDSLRIVSFEMSNDELVLLWKSAPGKSYQVLGSTDLTTWQILSTEAGTGDEVEFTIPSDDLPNSAPFFVRVAITPTNR